MILDCLIALSGACLLNPSNVQLEAGLSTQLSGDIHYFQGTTNYGGGHVGRIAIVLEQPLTHGFSYRTGIQHTSLIETNRDRGEERWFFDLTWRPFR